MVVRKSDVTMRSGWKWLRAVSGGVCCIMETELGGCVDGAAQTEFEKLLDSSTGYEPKYNRHKPFSKETAGNSQVLVPLQSHCSLQIADR